MARGLDVRAVSFSKVLHHHMSSSTFRSRYGSQVFGYPGSWNRALSTMPSTNTCAMRVSMAFNLARCKMPWTPRSWQYRNGSTKYYLPASAGEFLDRPVLRHARTVTRASDIRGQRGIIYFGWTGMGHITLWTGRRCHFNDAYWRFAQRIAFWSLR